MRGCRLRGCCLRGHRWLGSNKSTRVAVIDVPHPVSRSLCVARLLVILEEVALVSDAHSTVLAVEVGRRWLASSRLLIESVYGMVDTSTLKTRLTVVVVEIGLVGDAYATVLAVEEYGLLLGFDRACDVVLAEIAYSALGSGDQGRGGLLVAELADRPAGRKHCADFVVLTEVMAVALVVPDGRHCLVAVRALAVEISLVKFPEVKFLPVIELELDSHLLCTDYAVKLLLIVFKVDTLTKTRWLYP
jgi:hypothetical protein